ncbi:hypothetical protein HK097_009629, partial [Rhizophlyctis rosea]
MTVTDLTASAPIPKFRRDFRDQDIPDFPDESLGLLQRYTGEKDVTALKKHVVGIVEDVKRDLHVYGCISNVLFLEPRAPLHPFYPTFIASQTSSTRTLEVGVCFGTDFRQYVLDGVNPKNVTVADLHDGYWKLGGKLYKDEASKGMIEGVNTLFGDFAAVEGGERAIDLKKEGLDGTFDFVLTILVIHVFSYNEGKRFLTRLHQALRPGGILFGQGGGSTHSGPWDSQTLSGAEVRWRHNASSLKQLLEEIGFVDVEVLEQPFGVDRRQGWEKISIGDES